MEDNETCVDSTYERQMPLHFTIGASHVVVGLDAALQRMSVGQVCEITVPPLYAYGWMGCPPTVPPRTTLIYQVELLEVDKTNQR